MHSCKGYGYKYEYYNICYSKCPADTYVKFDKPNECFDKTPKGYYFTITSCEGEDIPDVYTNNWKKLGGLLSSKADNLRYRKPKIRFGSLSSSLIRFMFCRNIIYRLPRLRSETASGSEYFV